MLEGTVPDGFWLDTVARHGIPASGIDICEGPVHYAQTELQQDAHLGDFMDHGLAPNAFDVYCMWDTIEHLPYPEQFIARAHATGG